MLGFMRGGEPAAMRGGALLALVVLLGACAGVEERTPIRIESTPGTEAVSTAHAAASDAALAMLAQGGAAIDAAVAAQMVVGLVEPQSSGVGGGTFILLWDAASRRLTAFDGLAAAPSRVTPGLAIDVDGSALPLAAVRRSGRSVGVPGTVAVLKHVHERYGRLPWARLFDPAIEHAERGFPLPPYLHRILAGRNAARDHPQMVPLYFGADGRVLPIGSIVRNPDYADTMRRLAALGPSGLYDEGGAQRWIAAAGRPHATLVTEADLRGYRVVEREPVCAPFLAYRVCAMPPPSFGGIVVLQMLQMLEARNRGAFDFADPAFAHLYAEAGRLAQADRRRYVGDPGHVDVPTAALLARDYVISRAQSIDPQRAEPRPSAGNPGGEPRVDLDADPTEQHPATSQLAIADRSGNVLSMTTTINSNFGARRMIDGYVLNNALINFAPAPAPGRTLANQMGPGKRPISAMAPTIAFDARGEPMLAGGAAGGGYIVDYIARSVIDMLANGLTPEQALARGHISTANPGRLRLERGTGAEALADALTAAGHEVEIAPMQSGLGFLKRTEAGWLGAADPRRDGIAVGR
jgi:gamma-glutamyltranspeptidase/glutathione hydrolase